MWPTLSAVAWFLQNEAQFVVVGHVYPNTSAAALRPNGCIRYLGDERHPKGEGRTTIRRKTPDRPNIPNVGASFVSVLEYVAKESPKNDEEGGEQH